MSTSRCCSVALAGNLCESGLQMQQDQSRFSMNCKDKDRSVPEQELRLLEAISKAKSDVPQGASACQSFQTWELTMSGYLTINMRTIMHSPIKTQQCLDMVGRKANFEPEWLESKLIKCVQTQGVPFHQCSNAELCVQKVCMRIIF